MWIVKLGGSLARSPASPLPRWLAELARFGGGRVVIVPGGGVLADQVRALQHQWGVRDLVAHNMAVLAMGQNALMLQGLEPELVLAANEAEIRHALRAARVPVWLPIDMLREQADALTHWGVTSDSLAAWLANRLHAERLVIVKSCAIDPHADAEANVQSCIERGVVDAAFADHVKEAPYAIDIVGPEPWADLRERLSMAVTAC